MLTHPSIAAHAPALPPILAGGRFAIDRAPAGALRWHLGYRGGRYIVARRVTATRVCCEVVPTFPGIGPALKLADALNRAYGIDPLAGYDVSAAVFGT